MNASSQSEGCRCRTCGARLETSHAGEVCPACALENALGVPAAPVEESPATIPDAATEIATASPHLGRFGDYELLEEIARGGMGVVYKAHQVSLDRLVAVKMLLFSPLASPEHVQRFRTEATAAGSLHHPNIVSIHEVGILQNQHYLVMDFVNGPPLSRLVTDQPLAPQRAAGYVKTIAEAIHYAHERGVLHRDLKPSNVLIDANDQLKVTDFGLAKRLDRETELTLSGQVLGSPGYMAPEQAAAQRGLVGKRSDVYSLGAILYHLITGRAPFMAATVAETLQQVQNAEPVSPTILNPHIPHDLKTICLKCLEKDPARRYQSACELAQDLGRWLRKEPIEARPISQTEKAWRWCRRRPLVASLTASTVLAILLGFAGVLWQWRRANVNAHAEAQQRQRAEASFQNAREVIDRMFIQVADELEGLPRTEQIRRKLLEDALQYYQGFLKEKGEDPSVKEGAAVAYARLGTIYARLGRFGESLAPLRQGIALLEDLGTRHPLTVPDRVELAWAHATLASARFWFYPDNDEILAHSRRRLALWEELRREFPTVPNYLRMVAFSETGLGNALRDANRPEEAIEHFRRALQLCEDDYAQPSDAAEHQKLTAHVHHWWGAMLEHTGHRDEAEREYRVAMARREQLQAAQPNDAWLKYELAHIKIYLAELLMKRGRLKEAEELLRAEVALHAQLLQDFPGTSEYRRHASWGLQALGRVLAAQGRWGEAEVAQRRSLEEREKLVVDFPNVPAHLDALADHCYKLGLLLAATGRSDQANKAFRKSQGQWEQLVAPSAKTRTCERNLARMLATCPTAEFRNPQRAVILAKQSMLHEGVKAEHWSLLGIAQYRAGDLSAAIESLHKSMELDNGGDAMQWLFLAMSHWKQEHPQQAREWYDKAAAWLEKVHPADEAYGRFRAEAASLLEIKTTDRERGDNTTLTDSP